MSYQQRGPTIVGAAKYRRLFAGENIELLPVHVSQLRLSLSARYLLPIQRSAEDLVSVLVIAGGRGLLCHADAGLRPAHQRRYHALAVGQALRPRPWTYPSHGPQLGNPERRDERNPKPSPGNHVPAPRPGCPSGCQCH